MRGIDIYETLLIILYARNRYKLFLYGHQYQSNDRILPCYSKYKRVRRMNPNPNFPN